MKRVLAWIAAAAVLAAMAGLAAHLASGDISPQAQELIDRGDAARDESQALQAEAQEIAARIEALVGAGASEGSDPTVTRSLAPAAEDGGIDALRARLAAIEDQRRKLDSLATELWMRAASIDAEAQDAILQRLRGTRPKS